MKQSMTIAAVCMFALPCFAADKPLIITTKSGVEMALLPAGTFKMGDEAGMIDAKPVREVRVSSFYIDTREVTQAEYERVMGANPARWIDPNNPVEQVRWSDAVRYCNARSKLDGLEPAYNLETWACNFDASGYRLPTEAEWEYAARAGTDTKYFWGDDAAKLKAFAWTKDNAGGRPHPVGEKHPNPWGLYDVYGNVWEWCNDLYGPRYYTENVYDNPKGPAESDTRIVRGGCWNARENQCTSAYRYSENPGYSDICFGYDIYGIRCVRKAEAK